MSWVLGMILHMGYNGKRELDVYLEGDFDD